MRKIVLAALLSMILVPGAATVAFAANPSGHDGHTTDGGGGGSGKGEHDNHYTCPPDSSPDNQHDRTPA